MHPGPPCPANRHCVDWAIRYLSYCLCSVKDGAALSLGLMSVICWGVAEVPQIITNYKLKSNEGLSIAFLSTWIVGDLFNLIGCLLEPATLPSQYYVAWLYTTATSILFGQTIYYRYIYPRLKSKRQQYKSSFTVNVAGDLLSVGGLSDSISEVSPNPMSEQPIPADDYDKLPNMSETSDQENVVSSPIPLPHHPTHSSPGQGLYYISARSLSSSHTPMAGSFPRMNPNPQSKASEPLLPTGASTLSTTPPKGKYLYSLLAGVTFFGTSSLHRTGNGRNETGMVSGHPDGITLSVGRKLLRANHGPSRLNDAIGTSLGWGMAVIYMGGRFPQIWLNIQRGDVEGLNPTMFLFAIVGNATYVASILLNSLQWSKLRPNMPWLVDAMGCVLLDIFIMIQFFYYSHRRKRSLLK